MLRSHCAVIEIRSLVLARDDGSRALCCICGCKLFIRQKNIRTKELIECSDVCSIELDKHMLIQCCASAMLWALLYFCREEQKKWAFTLVTTASFMAGTRNIVGGSALCSRGHCADIEKRSLV